MSKHVFPAHGWLPEGAHYELKWDDQGHDLATNWQGSLQAPGNGEVVEIASDRPFPNGFGPDYPIVRIDTGPWAGHTYYLGHTSAAVKAGTRLNFGQIISHADQGHDWAHTVGGWCELGEWFPGRGPGPKAAHHWFDSLLLTPLVIDLPDPPLVYGDQGMRVLGMSSRLRDCGYLPRPYWHFNRPVHGALVRFQAHHKLPHNHGVLDALTDVVLSHASQWCKAHHHKEV